jgi:hypothetical protein
MVDVFAMFKFIRIPKADDMLFTPKMHSCLFQPLGFLKGFKDIAPKVIFSRALWMLCISIVLSFAFIFLLKLQVSDQNIIVTISLVLALYLSLFLAPFFFIYCCFLFIAGLLRYFKNSKQKRIHGFN